MFKIKIKERIVHEFVGRYFRAKGSDRIWKVAKIDGDDLYWDTCPQSTSLSRLIENIKSGEAIEVYKI